MRALLVGLDDAAEPMAEICRRVGNAAEKLGLVRPSYVHVRRFLRAQRLQQAAEQAKSAAVRAVAADVVGRLVAGRWVDPYYVADRLEDARREYG